jgi:hypothetical protein
MPCTKLNTLFLPFVFTTLYCLISSAIFAADLSTSALASTKNTNPFQLRESPLQLLKTLSNAAPHANPKVIATALSALNCAIAQGITPARHLTLIDYSLASSKPRLWVFDLLSGKLLFEELVAHGRNSGENFASHFSNRYGSLQSSLGLFLTKETYVGSNGYSLRMEGLENGINDNALERAIVFHGAPYVNPRHVRKFGRIGRSWGCPAVNTNVARKVIDTIKDEQFLFSYYPDQHWLSTSQFLHCPQSQVLAKNMH